MADPRFLEQRLIMRESVISLPSVTRIATKLRDLSEKQEQGTLDAFVREVRLFQLEASKSIRVLKVCDSEMEEYSGLESALLKQIEDTEVSIQELETDLGQAKQIRKHRNTCELLAQDVAKFPSRASLEKQTKGVDDSIVQCEQAILDMNDRITQRVSQFKALLQAIADLKGSLKEEEEQLRLAMLQQQALQAAGGVEDESLLVAEEILEELDSVRGGDGRGKLAELEPTNKAVDEDTEEGSLDEAGEVMEIADEN